LSTPKRVLITGGAGFIGSHLTEKLLGEGHYVSVLDDLSTGRLENIQPFFTHPNYAFCRSSILDPIVLDRIASQSQIIVHLAAAVGVKLIVDRPVHTIETNVLGTEAVFKAALRYRCRVMLASTSEVYGKGNRIPFSEEDDVLLGPTSKSRWSYAASKMTDEFLGFAYHREHQLDFVPFRLFNTVGPRQSGQYGMVIPTLVRQALRGEELRVFGDGSQSRCFCDVRDVISAIWGLAVHEGSPGKLFNIGSTEEITILELARRIKALAHSTSEIKIIPYAEAYAPGFEDMQRRVPDTTRIRQFLGWAPKRSLDEILRDIITYERAQLGAQP
jgi:UDP-glucose 4-epimerase